MFNPMIAPHVDPPALLKALADPTRLRILGLLELEELSVGELTRTLGLSQSRVSNHLRVLRDQGLLIERRTGTSTRVRVVLDREGDFVARLWSPLRDGLRGMVDHDADRARLQTVLAERSGADDFFDRVAGQWDKLGERFASGQARQRSVAGLLQRGLVLADLGCGAGYMARALAPLASTLICVDRSENMLDEARRNLAHVPGNTQVDFRAGDLDALPIEDAELDGAVLGMVLHHLSELDATLREVHRALRPGGTLSILELQPHKESWMHEDLGDQHLGLDATDVIAALRRTGFSDVHLEPVDDHYCPIPQDGGEAAHLPLYLVRACRTP
tara:strand:+ start:76 stop:1065 length:990 start_codon:yes stop_codon:yes gene_type:complete